MKSFRSPSSLLPDLALLLSLAALCRSADAQSSLVDIIDYYDDFAVTSEPGIPAGPGNPRPNGFFGDNNNGAYNVKTNNLGITAVYRPAGAATPTTSSASTRPRRSSTPAPATRPATPAAPTASPRAGAATTSSTTVHATTTSSPSTPSSPTTGSTSHPAPTTSRASSHPAASASSSATRPGGIFGGTSIDIFKPDPAAPNGLIQTAAPVGHNITVDDQNWHNFAVEFDRLNNRLKTYVDNVLLNDLDLTTFADGVYANFSNATISFGGSSGGGPGFASYVDNLTVGTPVIPEPAAVIVFAVAAPLLRRRRR